MTYTIELTDGGFQGGTLNEVMLKICNYYEEQNALSVPEVKWIMGPKDEELPLPEVHEFQRELDKIFLPIGYRNYANKGNRSKLRLIDGEWQ